MALQALKENRLRSILTLFGIIIGVFAIIAVMTAIQTLQNAINSGLNVFGADVIYVQKMPAIQVGGRRARRKYWRRPNITYEQGVELSRRLKVAQYVSLNSSTGGKLLRYRDRKTNPNVSLVGIDQWGLAVFNHSLAAGRPIIKEDVNYDRRVALLGQDVLEKLFPYEDPIGRRISIQGVQFTVVGILESKGAIFGQSQDNMVLIPITTFLQYFSRRHTSIAIAVKPRRPEEFDATREALIGQLRIVRGLKPDEENNFEIISNSSLIETFGQFLGGVKAFAFAISIVALLVAGIGIMNIMLVSVSERIKEIGIRKAVGATRGNILFQFLLEAVFLTELGGLVGVFLGIAAGNAVTFFIKVKPVIPMDWVFIGLFICSAVGIIFGIYPAYRAARLDPITSLRHE